MSIVKSLFNWLTGQQFILYMGGGGGGQPNTTYSQTSNIPEYAQPYVEQMLGSAQKEIFNYDASGNPSGIKPYKPFSSDPNDYFAGFSPMQRQAQQQAQNMQVTPETGIAAGMTGAAGMGALGTQYNPMGAYSQQFGQQQADLQGNSPTSAHEPGEPALRVAPCMGSGSNLEERCTPYLRQARILRERRQLASLHHRPLRWQRCIVARC